MGITPLVAGCGTWPLGLLSWALVGPAELGLGPAELALGPAELALGPAELALGPWPLGLLLSPSG